VRVALALAALLLLPAAAGAGITGFQTPSGNIFCAYVSFENLRELRCDISRTTNAPPPKPKSCEHDWGYAFGLSPRGKGHRICVSDTPMDPSFKKLAYGRTWKRGPFTCRSRTAHLRCTNTRGHGFQLNRSKQTLF
jgi:hypothetical protein